MIHSGFKTMPKVTHITDRLGKMSLMDAMLLLVLTLCLMSMERWLLLLAEGARHF